MNGQLWEPCSKRGCSTEPVCMDCGYCERHCTCAGEKQTRAMAREIARQDPEFWQRVIRHQEQGGQET